MQQIPSSNLLLLVTDRTCDCSAYSPILQEATEVKYILPTLRGARQGVAERSWSSSDLGCRAQILTVLPCLQHHDGAGVGSYLQGH